MTSRSEQTSLRVDLSHRFPLESYEETVQMGFRWLLRVLLVWVALAMGIGVPFFFVRKIAVLVLGCILGVTYLVDLYLLRRGRFRAASWLFLIATWLASFVVVVFRGGLGGQYVVFLLAISIAAGWLLGGRSMLLFSAIALISTLVLAILQTLGFEPPNYFSGRHPIGLWLFFVFSLITAVVPLKHILESLRDSVSALRRSEAKYRALVHSIDGIVWEADAQSLEFTFVSQSAERILGYPLTEWREDAAFWWHHLVNEDRDRVLHLCGAAGQVLGDFEFQCRMIAADARVVWMHVKVQVVADPGCAPKLRGIMVDISRHAQAEVERKRAEEALRQSEKELLEAQRVAQVGSWLWDPQTDTVVWSLELYHIAGRDPTLPPPSYNEQAQLYTAESWERMQRSVAETLRSGTPYKLDLEMIRPDGTTRWIVDRGEALRDDTGRIVRLHGTAQDITERKQAEDALRLFRALIDQSNDAIEVVDPGTLRFLDVNERACADLGYGRNELLSMSVFDIDPNAEGTKLARGGELKTTGFILTESIHRRKDGSTFPVEVGVRSIYLDRMYYVAVVRDITQRKQAEMALRSSESRFRSLFEFSPDAIILTDAAGRITEMNSQVEKFFGYARAELAGQPVETLIPERFRQAHPGHRGDYNAAPHIRTMGIGLDLTGRRKDGSEFPVDIMLSPIEAAEGRVALSVIRDVTARKRAEEALRRQEATVRSLFQLTKTLTSTLDISAILDSLNLQSMLLVNAEGACAGLRREDSLSCESFFSGYGFPEGGFYLAAGRRDSRLGSRSQEDICDE
jgi:PAS domain S-box-containing protein